MSTRVWDKFLTDQDRRVFELAGYGKEIGFGSRPALFIIDVQYNFCGDEPDLGLEEGLRKYRTFCGKVGWEAVPHIERLMHIARKRSIPIFYTQSERRPDMIDSGIQVEKSYRGREGTSTEGTHATQTVSPLKPRPQDFLIGKRKPSAFFGTIFMSHLNYLGIDTLIMTGCTTSGCLRATTVDAYSFNFKTIIPEEAVFDRFEASHAMNLFDLNSKYADVIGVDAVANYMDEINHEQ